MYLPGTAIEIAKAAKLSRKTRALVNGAQRLRKGRGYRYEFVEVPDEQARELIELFEDWLAQPKHGIAETASVRQAVERLGGVVEPTPQQEERRAQARLRNIQRAQEVRLRKQRERAEKIEGYERAASHWLAHWRSLPDPNELQEGHPKAVERLNRLVREAEAAIDHVKGLYGALGKIRDVPENEAEREGLRTEIAEATHDRDLVVKALRKQRYKMASPARQRAYDTPMPRPEAFGLTRKDIGLEPRDDE